MKVMETYLLWVINLNGWVNCYRLSDNTLLVIDVTREETIITEERLAKYTSDTEQKLSQLKKQH